nr:amidohydrolase [Eubacterium sp.]
MLVINGMIWTMAGKPVEHGYVRWNEGKITEIGNMKELGSEPFESERVLDAHGGWVMPGLIDAHCHVGIAEEKWGTIGDDCNEMTTPITPHLRGLDGINPMDPAFHDAIMAGVTSLMTGPGSSNPVGGQSVFLKVQGRCVDNMIVKAPAAMKVAFGENPKVNYGNKDAMPGTRMAVAAMIREQLYQACQYQEDKSVGKLEKTDFRMECWLPVLRKKIPLKAHAHRADDILTAIRIAKEFDVRLTLDHCTEGHLIAEEILRSGFPAIVGPDLTARSKLEVQNMSFKTAGVLAKAGVKVAVMTDHPVSLIRYLPLCAGLCVKQGLPMEEGLKAITIHAAEICGVADRVGSLEVGKDADIAVFTGNPMETFTRTLATVVDGEVVYEEKL